MSDNANNPAFATPSVELPQCIETGQVGLTKREYAAIQIMAQMAVQEGHVANNAARAVRAADALLAELAK